MNMIRLFISRPIGTSLLTLAVAIVGFFSYTLLPISPLPQAEFPVIVVSARLPGASPETMASTVATPLERSFGRIAGVDEIFSSSSLGSTQIVLVFDINRDINGAAVDVQGAINAARSSLPTLPSNPSYWKVNPSDSPILVVSLTSDTLPIGTLYDVASTVISQKIAQVYGVGQVEVGGGSLPAVRVEVNPGQINSMGIALGEVKQAIASANVNLPKGTLNDGETQWFIGTNDQLQKAKDFAPIIIRSKNETAVRLQDVAAVVDSVQNLQMAGYANGKKGVSLYVYRQPDANIIETIKRVKETLPLLHSWLPERADLNVLIDRSAAITASVKGVEKTLLTSVALVILVVFLFLRNGRATFIPAIAVPVSLLGTFTVMYFCNFSLNHFSLMALTIATGFVVDDAIVVTENIVRHIERGEKPFAATLKGSKEVFFTVISISISLIAIFAPILFMGGLPGKLFREFSVTLSAAVLVSLAVSLVTTPMLCARILRAKDEKTSLKKENGEEDREENTSPFYTKYIAHLFSSPQLATLVYENVVGSIRKGLHGIQRILQLWSNLLERLYTSYARTLLIVVKHRFLTLFVFFLTIIVTVYLYISIPKGFFPEQDTGQIRGSIKADQSISFAAMEPKFLAMLDIVNNHPDVQSVMGFTGGRKSNSGRVSIMLKPSKERKKSTFAVIKELRGQLSKISGVSLKMKPMQDLRAGGRDSKAMYDYTLQSDDLKALRAWTPKVYEAIQKIPGVIDASNDQDDRSLQTTLDVDRNALAKYGIQFRQVDSTLGMAFGQSFATTVYTGTNQYPVVMEFERQYLQGPDNLWQVYVPASSESSSSQTIGQEGNAASSIASATSESKLVPLMAFSEVRPTIAPKKVEHQGQFTSSTISFNLEEGYSLSEVDSDIRKTLIALHVPSSIKGTFEGNAKMFSSSSNEEDILLLATLFTLYVVLGILYESFIHPLTILSTLPSAGLGALLGLMLFSTQFTLIAFMGVLLLSGVVKKNAILMIDFAIAARREEGLSALDAIYKACLLRFRPIMMTTMAAIFSALPLILASGDGSELLRPLGITIVGGLLVSQLLTLYTTPVIYIFLDRFTKQGKEEKKSQLLKGSIQPL